MSGCPQRMQHDTTGSPFRPSAPIWRLSLLTWRPAVVHGTGGLRSGADDHSGRSTTFGFRLAKQPQLTAVASGRLPRCRPRHPEFETQHCA